MRRTSFLIVIAATTALASPAMARSTCGLIEEMQPGETLEQLAARCGTEPEEILRVNDAETVADLPEGKLKMPVWSLSTALATSCAAQIKCTCMKVCN